jgi:hypothetical protein
MNRNKELVGKEKNILFCCIKLCRQVWLPKLVQLAIPCMETWLLAGWSRNGFSNPGRCKRCFLLKSVQTDSENHQTSLTIHIQGPFLRSKVVRARYCPLPSSAEFKNAWNYTSMGWYLSTAILIIFHSDPFKLDQRHSLYIDAGSILIPIYVVRNSIVTLHISMCFLMKLWTRRKWHS